MYFSERELGSRARIDEEIKPGVWGGIVTSVNRLIENGYFGNSFPAKCPDNDGIVGTDARSMGLAVLGEILEIAWPLSADNTPTALTILDLIEFCYQNIAKPIRGYYHQYWGQYHLDFDISSGQDEFRQIINRLLARNGLAFDLQENGQITRLAPPTVHEKLQATVFKTGDAHLDDMLEMARTKYLNSNPLVRRESLEKLWDAWERLKTIEYPSDKKKSATILLDRAASEAKFRERLDREAKELTDIGNCFMIRHTETDKVPINSDRQVDYLFQRLFSLVYLLIRSR